MKIEDTEREGGFAWMWGRVCLEVKHGVCFWATVDCLPGVVGCA
jgi:hypothetical protein